MNADTEILAGVQLQINGKDYLLLLLSLPFVGSPCPSEFCLFSDMITYSIDDLMACKDWKQPELASDYVHKIPASIELPSNIPFAQAKEIIVDMIKGEDCKADVFIDNIIKFVVEKGDNLEIILAGPCTIMNAVAHNASSDIFVPRKNLIADDKNEA